MEGKGVAQHKGFDPYANLSRGLVSQGLWFNGGERGITVEFRLNTLQTLLQQVQSDLNFDIRVVETVDSTNRLLWEWVDQGAGEGTAAIALQQQTGRGQWGHDWCSEPGGLYLSVALCPQIPVEQAYQLTLCTAWGIAEALRQWSIPVQLKWPNDLVVNQRKLGGILTETRSHAGFVHQAVVGIGLNWSNSVPQVGINLVTVMQEYGIAGISSLEEVGAIALAGLDRGYRQWQQHGIEAICLAYGQLLNTRGALIQVEGQWARVTGVACNGELQLRWVKADGTESAGEHTLPPGTIHLGYGELPR